MPRAPSPAQGPPVDFPTVSPPLGLSGRARCVSPRSPYMWGKIAGSACTVGRDYPLWWADYNGVSAARARARMVAGGERGQSRGRRCGVPLRPNPTASAALALAFAGAGLAPLRRVRRLEQAGHPPVRGQRRCLRRVVRQELLLSTARVSGAPQHVCAPRFSPCNGLSGGCDAPGLASARARAAVWRGLVCAWPVALSRNTDHSSRHWRGGERTAWHRRATRRAQDRALAPGLRDRSHVPSGGACEAWFAIGVGEAAEASLPNVNLASRCARTLCRSRRREPLLPNADAVYSPRPRGGGACAVGAGHVSAAGGAAARGTDPGCSRPVAGRAARAWRCRWRRVALRLARKCECAARGPVVGGPPVPRPGSCPVPGKPCQCSKLPLHATHDASRSYGADVSSHVSPDQWKCLKGDGINFAIVRAWYSFGAFDPNGRTTVANAWAGGMDDVDVYLFPCAGKSAADQVAGTVSGMSGVKFGQM